MEKESKLVGGVPDSMLKVPPNSWKMYKHTVSPSGDLTLFFTSVVVFLDPVGSLKGVCHEIFDL